MNEWVLSWNFRGGRSSSMTNTSWETLSKSSLLSRPHFPHLKDRRVGENDLMLHSSLKFWDLLSMRALCSPCLYTCSSLTQGTQHVVLYAGVCSLLEHVPASVWEAAGIEVCSPGFGNHLPRHRVRSFTSSWCDLKQVTQLSWVSVFLSV